MDAHLDAVRLSPDLVAAFRDLDFSDHDAILLALNHACPDVVRYRLEDCHMTHAEAVAIYS